MGVPKTLSTKLGVVDVGDCIGDVLPMYLAGSAALFDLDAVRSAGGEAVHNVARAVAAVIVARPRNVHRDARAGNRAFDGALDLPL